MSPVLDSAVAVAVPGPTIDFKPPPTAAPPKSPPETAVEVCLNEGKRKEREERDQNGFFLSSIDGCSESSSSSIGEGSLSDGEGDEEEGEVQSRLKEGPLGCLDSLEDALPIKKGLSSCFSGKSKSFASLSDAATAKDLVKPENPFNKRRRILMARKVSLSRRASHGSLNRVTFKTPDLPLVEEDEEENRDFTSPLPCLQRRQQFRTFRSSSRSFSLSDLQYA
ncbi:hypothetical protein QJS10_CPA05g02393 [Acorus calamus]|uniref:Uncharacterized protein n=1 Tax=Acorus calamus TaxID=4465 RepID=A0AAV9ERY2_ACOCL|nr:hypothetical protein QJS10_CPA05g02393 [Acorus calamus]